MIFHFLFNYSKQSFREGCEGKGVKKKERVKSTVYATNHKQSQTQKHSIKKTLMRREENHVINQYG
jgi:hypothetical protein